MEKSEQKRYAKAFLMEILIKHKNKNLEYIQDVFYKAQDLIETHIFASEILFLEVKKLLDGQRTNNYATTLYELSKINIRLGKFNKAESQLILSLDSIKENGGENKYYSILLQTLANLYIRMNKFDKAELNYETVLEIKRKLSGEDSIPYAIALHGIASLYQMIGKYSLAETCFVRAKDILKLQSYDFKTDTNYGDCLYSLANFYTLVGKYKNVGNLFNEALAVIKCTKGDKSKKFAMALHGYAYYFMQIGNYKEAECYYKEALEITKEKLEINDLFYAKIVHSIACLYFLMGKYNDSHANFIEAMELKKKIDGVNSYSYAISLQASSNLYLQMGRLYQAETGFKESLKILKECKKERTVEYSSAIHGLASLYAHMGNFSDAEAELNRALNLEKDLFGERSIYYAATLHEVANYYFDINKFEESERCYISVLGIIADITGEKTINYAVSLYRLGCLYNHMNYVDKAIECLSKCLDIYKFQTGEFTVNYAACLHELGSIYARRNNLNKAEDYFEKAQQIVKEVIGDKTIMYASILHSFSYVNRLKDELNEAEYFLKKSLNIKKELLGTEVLVYANSLHELASVYIKMKKYYEAESILLSCLDIKKKTVGEFTMTYAFSCYNLSIVYYNLKKYEDAISISQKAIYLMDSISKNVLYKNMKNSASAFMYYIRMFQNMYLSLHRAIEKYVSKFDLSMLLFRKFGEVSIVNLKDRLFNEIATEDVKSDRNNLIKEINTIEEKLSQLLFMGQYLEPSYELTNESYVINNKRKVKIEYLEIEKEKLEKRLWKIEMEVLPNVIDLESYRTNDKRLLLDGFTSEDIFVEFVKFIDVLDKSEEKYSVIIFQPKNNLKINLVHLNKAEVIDSLVIQLRKAYYTDDINFNSSEDFERWLDSDKRKSLLEVRRILYSEIIRPIQGFISETKAITICADGELCRLPFEIFLEGKRIKYLNTISDSIWLNGIKGTSNNRSLIAYDANYDIIPFDTYNFETYCGCNTICSFDNIIYSAMEGRKIEERFDKCGVKFHSVSGLYFNKKSLVETCRPVIFHISTHGYYKENLRGQGFENQSLCNFVNIFDNIYDPFERSGFVVSGINAVLENDSSKLKDFIVTARDILHMDLLGTKLVVLSACDCGLGDIKVGDGVYGLQRAFMLSGTKTLIMALWKVDAMATCILFWKFYEYLLNGLRIDESLDKAKMYIKNAKKEELISEGWDVVESTKENPFRDPYFWAGFICMGDGGCLY